MTYLTVFSLKFVSFSIILQLYLTVQGQDDNAKVQRDLDLLLKWEQEWDMELNTSCHVVRACTLPVHVDLSTLHTPCMARSLTLWTLIDILV